MVAAHAWDVHGALRAGLQGAYVQRGAGAEPYGFPPGSGAPQPRLVARDFADLAAQLAAL